MQLPDPVDILDVMLPRWAKRLLALAFIAICLVDTPAAGRIMQWYCRHEVQVVFGHLGQPLRPSISPVPTSVSVLPKAPRR